MLDTYRRLWYPKSMIDLWLWILLGGLTLSAIAFWGVLFYSLWKTRAMDAQLKKRQQQAQTQLSTLWDTEAPVCIVFMAFPADAQLLFGIAVHRRQLDAVWIPLILEAALVRNIPIYYTLATFTSARMPHLEAYNGVLVKALGNLHQQFGNGLLVIGADLETKTWLHFTGKGVPKED